jgi:hypothetical protein
LKSTTSAATSKISNFLNIIVLVVLALALVSLALAFNAFMEGEEIVAIYLVIIGFIALGLSTYVLMQSRSRVAAMKIETPKTLTTIECRKCGFKNVREFQRGDYVYKDLDKCQKCDDRQIITAIYKEVKEKEKTFPF